MLGIKKSKPNIQLYKLVAKSITPVVLLVGLLLLVLYHFNAVLNITQTNQDLFQGVTAFSVGGLEMNFQRDAGIDRPAVVLNGLTLMSYAEWNSTISVDGHVQGLWDTVHGYTVDAAHNQIFSTASGTGWQVTQTVTLVNDHSVTVTYQFTARHVGAASPHSIIINVAHLHSSSQPLFWFNPSIQNNTFTAEELPLLVQNPRVPYDPNTPQSFAPLGTTTLTVSGPAVPANAITINDAASALVGGKEESWASQLTTTYKLTNPAVDQFVTLGTETISFQPAPGNSPSIILPLPSGE
jgi:hypothetical protein